MYAKLTQIFCLLFSLIEILFAYIYPHLKHFAPSLLGTLACHPSHLSQTRTWSTAPQPSKFNHCIKPKVANRFTRQGADRKYLF